MLLNEIFFKDIQRPIEGVIKADDTANLGTEVEEYVLTNEVSKGVETLLEEYTNYTNANGVWISGYYGSGKSHLLKMLAHLLGDVEGQAFDRSQVAESFRSKSEGAFLPALLKKAENIRAKSLLFNIDQKANLIAKDQSDVLLKVFVKVFDECRGYFGDQGHIARFERQLDEDGLLEDFKIAFKSLSGREWVERRPINLPSVHKQVNEAYARVSGIDESKGSDILAYYLATYSVSIESFAKEVKTWLGKQPDGYRLNFFVDEVGQFIGSNTKLMLDLQTIAESLSISCSGRAWVFVTSQEDIEKVIGDSTKEQGSDFSKIQARFKCRVKLTSADVEEVIRKRLLEKNATGETSLKELYAEESANFGTLFSFVDGAKTYRNYSDEDHFVGTYPFISYQFPLFQAAIEGISDHNVFEGRNSSVGERSMIGVVQQVVKDIGVVELGTLATFDHMFAGIRSSLKSAAQRSIDVAEHHLQNPLAIRVLKVLFLVKYVESFQSTARNLTVLVYDRFGLDLPALTEAVKEALTLLETQTYIQRNGMTYEYLSNEEKVIEEEIKNVVIDASEVSTRLFKILSGDVIKTNKIRYVKNGQDFAFGFKLDDLVHGPQKELSVHFITPEYPFTLEDIRMHSFGKDELRVILEPDERVLSDLRLLLKTDKYTRLKQTSALTTIEQQILHSKASQNREREKELIQRIQASVGAALLVINAADIMSSSQDALGRVTEGFNELINRTYTQLNLLGGVSYSEQQVADAAKNEGGLFSGDALLKVMPAADEVMSFIIRRETLGDQVTMKAIVDAFQSKPYGWDLPAIEVIVASLIGASKVTLTVDGSTLKRSEVAGILRNTQKHAHTIVAPQKTFDEGKVANFRKFCTDFFDEVGAPKDPLELARHGGDKLKGKLDELKATVNGSKYPFVEQLSGAIVLLEQVVGKTDDWYLSEFNLGDDLLDAKENLIDPINSFLSGAQRSIYDEASALLASNLSNIGYLPDGSEGIVKAALADASAFRGNKMAQLKQAADDLSSKIEIIVNVKRTIVTSAIEERKAQLLGSADYAKATPGAQEIVGKRIDSIVARLASEGQIPLILQIESNFETNDYPQILDDLQSSQVGKDAPAQKQTVSVKTIAVPGAAGILETPEDVDRYLAAFRSALVETLDDGKRISL